MHTIIRAGDIEPSPRGTITFEGEPYGSSVSMFLIDNRPGEGPDLHEHPYTETWVVRSGKVRFTADGVEVEAGAGDLVVVGAETPHMFENAGEGRLEMVCIHASPRIIQRDLT
jgi:mannose-6-phosphate isomerase-like protein (cupin superfamily)